MRVNVTLPDNSETAKAIRILAAQQGTNAKTVVHSLLVASTTKKKGSK